MKISSLALSFTLALVLAFASNAQAGKKKVKAEEKPAAAAEEKPAAPAEKAAAPADKPAAAAEKPATAGKEVTLAGTMVCAKCSLKESATCQDVLKVGEGAKEVKYYLEPNAVAKENHGPVCSGSKKASVKGTVSEKEGKKLLAASEIKYE